MDVYDQNNNDQIPPDVWENAILFNFNQENGNEQYQNKMQWLSPDVWKQINSISYILNLIPKFQKIVWF